MTRAAVYTRSSVGDDTSTDRQERSCRSFCEARDWEVAEVFTDGVTGSGKKERPGWRALAGAVERREVDAVVVFAISRAARNTIALLEFARDCEAAGVEFESVSEPIGGEYGRVFLAILGSLAELEVKSKADRALLKRAEMRERGNWPGGRAPFGTRPVRAEGGWRLEPDPVTAPLVRRACELVLGGGSLRDVRRMWAEAGQGDKTPRSVRLILTGEAIVREGVVDPATARRVADLVRERGDAGRRAPRGELYLLTGILRCGACDDGTTVTGHRGRYVCRATGSTHITADAEMVEEDLFSRLPDEADLPRVDAPDPGDELLAELDSVDRRMRDFARNAALAGMSAEEISAGRHALAAEADRVQAALDARRPRRRRSYLDPAALNANLRAFVLAAAEEVTLLPVGRGRRREPGEANLRVVLSPVSPARSGRAR